MRIVLAAGGTGGHIMPALAVALAVRKLEPAADIFFVGAGKELEGRLIPEAGFELQSVPFVAVLGKSVRELLPLLWIFPRALFKALWLFICRRPDAVIGFGGYPAFVPLLAAWLLRIPAVLHEQNTEAGLSNRVAQHLVRAIFAPPATRGFSRTKILRVVALPVREEFYRLPPWSRQPAEPFRLLVVGGSQGARALSDAVVSLAPFLSAHNVTLVHQVGAGDVERVRRYYEAAGLARVTVLDFITDMAAELAAAHLVISRAGAMAVAEITAAGRPAIFVPLRIAAGHQAANAEVVVQAGGAALIEQDSELAGALRTLLEELLTDGAKIALMAQRAREVSVKGETTPAEEIALALVAQAKL